MEELIRLRHKLHQNPEVSGNEKETAKYILSFLSKYPPQEIISNLVASDRVSPRVGVMGLLVAISKMSMSTRGDKFVLKEKSKFAGIEKLACSGDKNTPPIYIVKFK